MVLQCIQRRALVIMWIEAFDDASGCVGVLDFGEEA